MLLFLFLFLFLLLVVVVVVNQRRVMEEEVQGVAVFHESLKEEEEGRGQASRRKKGGWQGR